MKRYHRYQMDFSSRWLRFFSGCMALSFFARTVYYFGLTNMADCNVLEILFSMLLPAAASAACLVMLEFQKKNAPGMYGLLGTALCLGLLIGCVLSGSGLRILLGLVWYLTAALVLLACVGGFLPGKLPVLVIFSAATVFRLLFFPPQGLAPWVLELSQLSAMAALAALPYGLKEGRSRESKGGK